MHEFTRFETKSKTILALRTQVLTSAGMPRGPGRRAPPRVTTGAPARPHCLYSLSLSLSQSSAPHAHDRMDAKSRVRSSAAVRARVPNRCTPSASPRSSSPSHDPRRLVGARCCECTRDHGARTCTQQAPPRPQGLWRTSRLLAAPSMVAALAVAHDWHAGAPAPSHLEASLAVEASLAGLRVVAVVGCCGGARSLFGVQGSHLFDERVDDGGVSESGRVAEGVRLLTRDLAQHAAHDLPRARLGERRREH